MELLIVAVFIIVLIIAVVNAVEHIADGHRPRTSFRYYRKQFLLTRAERDFFLVLREALGDSYLIVPQAHLSVFIDNKVVGQSWQAALRHINQKSVDFLVCDTVYLNPLLAIELDDSSHEFPERRERDHEVERILREADMPLLRIRNRLSYDVDEVRQRVKEKMRS